MVVVTWLTDRLAHPGHSSDRTRIWLDKPRMTLEQLHVHAARELARDFILGRTAAGDTDIGLELSGLKSDPRPEISQVGRDNETLLRTLAYEPEELDEDGWNEIAAIGARIGRVLDRNHEAEAEGEPADDPARIRRPRITIHAATRVE